MTDKQGSAKAIGIAVILVAALFIGFLGYSTDWTFKLQQAPSDGTDDDTPDATWKGGTFTLTASGRNSLDSSASLTAGTDYTSSFYGWRSGSWVFLGSDAGSGVNIESIADDEGFIWLLIEEKSTKYYYSDVPMTLSKNTYIPDYKWVDADGDTNKEFLYKISLKSIPEPASGYPARTFYPYFITLSNDGSYAASEALALHTSPADITGIGATTVTKYIGWKTKVCAEKQGIGIYKIEIVVNSTDTTKWQIDKVNIPGVGYIDGSQFEEDVRSSDTKYQYVVGSDFDDIVYWKVASGSNNEFDNTVAVKFTLADNDVLTFTLYVYEWLYDRTSTSDNDAVTCTHD